ncbi:MAG: DUF917 domain-containing protein [Deltaproteobacteria bacterium]|nr:DUF917 domain-containing protein [Deltaproteobacteria bacterium]
MARTTLKTGLECQDFVRGSCFFGTGGGGDPASGLEMLFEDMAAGYELTWIDPDELDEAAMTCCAWGMGSIAPRDPEETQAALARLGVPGPVHDRNLAVAVQELEAYAGVKVEAIIPLEPGGRNSPNPLSSGARLGIPLLDGDYAGRAIPEIVQILPSIAGHKPWPAAAVDVYGDVTIIRQAAAPPMAERIGKHLALAAFGSVAMAGFLLPAKEVRQLIVPGTASRSLKVGQSIRQAREEGQDPVRAALEASGARLLFQGSVVDRDWEDRDGYMFGNTYLRGANDFQGQEMRIWFKNENHVTWLNNKPHVTSPDLIVVLEAVTGRPLTNTVIAKGMSVSVLGLAAAPGLRAPQGLQVLSPKWFGFDFPYVPIEKF